MNKITRSFTTIAIFGLFINHAMANSIELEPIFNTPGFIGSNMTTTIEDKLVSLVHNTPDGESIYMTYYTFSRPELAKELVRAFNRNVKINLVLDDKNESSINIAGSAMNVLFKGFDQNKGLSCIKYDSSNTAPNTHFQPPTNEIDPELESCLTFCKAGRTCRGLAINHNKFMLFSKQKDGSSQVIAQTSSNLTDGQMRNFNDLLIIKNDAKLYDGYLSYWTRLKGIPSKKSLKGDTFTGSLVNGSPSIVGEVFPRVFGSDPVLKMLNRVNCRIPGSSVYAISAFFDREEIMKKLAQLRSEGCAVSALTRKNAILSSGQLVKKYLDTDAFILPYQSSDGNETLDNSAHSKTVLINASIDNSSTLKKMVITGSHNLDLFSLKLNDETLLFILNDKLYNQYLSYFEKIRLDIEAANLKSL